MFDDVQQDLRQILQSSEGCVTCGAFDILETITDQMMLAYFVNASGAVFSIVASFLTLYVIWQLGGSLAGRSFDRHELALMVIRCSIVMAFVATPEALFSTFRSLMDLSVHFGAIALQVVTDAGGDSGLDGMAALMAAVEQTFRGDLGSQIMAMWRDLSWRQFGQMLAIVVFVVPLAVLAWEMVKYFFRPLFYTYAIGMLLPFLLAATIFDKTLPIFFNGLRVLGASGLQLVLSSSMVAFIIIIMRTVAELAAGAPIELFGTFYVTTLVVTVVMIFLFPVVMELPNLLLDVVQGGGGESTAERFGKVMLKRRRAKAA